jgi:hypothetical protein
MTIHLIHASAIYLIERRMPGDGIEPPTRGFSVLFRLFLQLFGIIGIVITHHD